MTIVAGEDIIKATGNEFMAVELDNYLFTKSKEQDYKELEKHSTRTIMY